MTLSFAMNLEASELNDLPFDVLKLSSAIEYEGTTDRRHQVYLAAVALDNDRKLISRDWFVFYNNRSTPDSALRLVRRNSVNTPCEWSLIADLNRASKYISEIALVVTMKSSGDENIDFSSLDCAQIVMREFSSGNIVVQYDLDDEFYADSYLEFARFVRKNGGWHIVTDVNASSRDLLSVVGELL